MKNLKKYSIFESDNIDLSIEEFCQRYLPSNKYRIINGEIYADCDVILFNKKLDSVPNFAFIDGYIDVRNNNLKSFEFLPEECEGYLINMNPYEGELKKIVELTEDKSKSRVSDIYKEIFNKFILNCLESGVWYNGRSNDFGIKECWHDVKLEFYKKNKSQIFFGLNEILDLDDVEILKEQFNLKSRDWILELIEKLIEHIKSDDLDERRFYFLLFIRIISDEEKRIRDVVEGVYDIDYIYNNIDKFKNMNQKKLDETISLILKKLVRNESERHRDQTHDLFAFIGRDKFIENKEGNYKKTLEIENFIKIDIYDLEDLQMIGLMKIRAISQGGGSRVYFIWMPKGILEPDKDSYTEEEISDFIDEINKKKTSI